MSADTTRLQAELDAANARAAEQARVNEGLLRDKRIADFQAVISTALDDGRLTPALAQGMAEFAASLVAAENAAFEFSAGDAKVRKAPLVWFRDFVAALGKQVDLGESDAGRTLDPAASDFAAPAGCAVDAAGIELHRQVAAHRAAHPGLTYEQALGAVRNR